MVLSQAWTGSYAAIGCVAILSIVTGRSSGCPSRSLPLPFPITTNSTTCTVATAPVVLFSLHHLNYNCTACGQMGHDCRGEAIISLGLRRSLLLQHSAPSFKYCIIHGSPITPLSLQFSMATNVTTVASITKPSLPSPFLYNNRHQNKSITVSIWHHQTTRRSILSFLSSCNLLCNSINHFSVYLTSLSPDAHKIHPVPATSRYGHN